MDAARDANAARLGQLLHAVGDIYAVAEQIAILGYDIAVVDADAELQPLVLRHRRVASVNLLLDLDGAEGRLHRACELGDHAVAGAVEDAAATRRDQPIHHLAVRAKHVERSLLVDAHQPAVAGDIGG